MYFKILHLFYLLSIKIKALHFTINFISQVFYLYNTFKTKRYVTFITKVVKLI